ncbi:MAG: hypothetical protein AABZ74_12415 [Cyanobacteriota bacterium]
MSGVEGRNIGNYDATFWGTNEIKAGKPVGKAEGYATLNQALDVAKATTGAEVITEKNGKFHLNEVRGTSYSDESKSEISVRAYPSVNFSKFVAFTDDHNNVITQFNNTPNLEKLGNIDQVKAKLAMMPNNIPANQALKVAGTLLGVASPATYKTSEKLMESLKMMPKYLPNELKSKFEEMLTPKNLAILSATLAVYAASHAVGVGEAADAIMLGVALGFLGADAIKVGKDFYNFATVAANAKTTPELEKAAKHLADGISTALIDGAMVAVGSRVGRGGKPTTIEPKPTGRPPTTPVEPTKPIGRPSTPVEPTKPIGRPATPVEPAKPIGRPSTPVEATKPTIVEEFPVPYGNKINKVKVALKDDVAVPTGKVEIFIRGKAKTFTKEMAEELKSLNEAKKANPKEFEANPENVSKLKNLEKLKHNFERTLEMAKTLERAGIEDTPANNQMIIEKLLEAGKSVTKENKTITTEIKGSKGTVIFESKWDILPDGTKYMNTVILKPKK